MKRVRRRKCNHCGELYLPDVRNLRHQRCCSKEKCRCASKAERQRRWHSHPENRDYFKGAENSARVREWRARNPGYWRRGGTLKSLALQDVLAVENYHQTTVINEERQQFTLQDVLGAGKDTQPLLIIGLIARITGTTLQDDIEKTSRTLINLGHDIVGTGGRHEGNQAAHIPGPGTAGTAAI